ncbi:PREDICTED: ATP-dependent DNA helicase PIF2-like [Ipomoea nil]|uniref:ATP-dependent DNA helicase PIF2-like n=1 Tax=Ipomoea nil TaxID=35883 RepID=UPI000901AEE5|nr:PREDICTED: ATP-dependent DNA helicase PIF2-like [Ipomoea nil]
MGKTIEDYNLVDMLKRSDVPGLITSEIAHEQDLQVDAADLLAIDKLNVCQRVAFQTILDAVIAGKGAVFFVDGPGGTGKTFLYRCLLAAVRSRKWIALATATSGIAASILPGGRTAHSRFKLLVDGVDKYVCNIGKQTSMVRQFRCSKLILWDEASMAHRNIVESLDTKLRDIMDCNDLFGGKLLFLVEILENMRGQSDHTFAQYLMRVGNGTEPTVQQNKIIVLPKFLDQLYQAVYPDDLLITDTERALQLSRRLDY